MAILAMTDKFWQKVRVLSRSDCWIWLGAKKPTGYGNVRRNKIYTTAHRIAWELSFGSIPSGMHVLHSCDNPSCCNPHHLMLGTVMSNYVDMVKKGRERQVNKSHGEDHHCCKLTSIQVEEIRRRYVPGVVRQKDIAKEYGVSQRTISIITRNEGRKNG